MRTTNVRTQLNIWPITAWRSSFAARQRCAVQPSPAQGLPAKNNPISPNARSVMPLTY